MTWLCTECKRPAPDRVRSCVCPSSRVENERHQYAAKVSVPWRDELTAAESRKPAS